MTMKISQFKVIKTNVFVFKQKFKLTWSQLTAECIEDWPIPILKLERDRKTINRFALRRRTPVSIDVYYRCFVTIHRETS